MRDDGQTEFKSAVDGVAIWKRVLTVNEITAIDGFCKGGKRFMYAPTEGTSFIIR